MSSSIAASEAFEFLNAGTKHHYRGAGDTTSAARDRAAREAGVTPAQAERLWKHWRTMKFPNGDVYRLLRNKYGPLCEWVETRADAFEARRLGRNRNAVAQSAGEAGEGNSSGRS